MKNIAPWLWRHYAPKSLDCLRDGYKKEYLKGDILSGLTVGVVALPLAMAFAIASGVSPERGIFTAIVAGLLISIFSGSRYQIGGPTGAFVVIVSDIVLRHGYDGLALATLMAGGILLILAVSGLGSLIQYIPYPVTTGFTTGIALIIFSSQVKEFLGLPIESLPAEFIPKWHAIITRLPQLSIATCAIGGGSLLFLVVLRRFKPRLPGAIIVITITSALVAYFKLPVETIASRFGDIPAGLPSPGLPDFDLGKMRLLMPDALTIAILAAIESLLSAVVADGMTGDRHKPNAEIMGQGIANIATVFFGGIPATGAIARTATNIRAGAHTPLSGIIHALVLLGILLIAAPLAKLIPLAALAAVLIVVAYNMSELERFRYLFRAPRSDVAVLLITFLLTVLVDLNTAIEAGVILAALLFMKRMIQVSEVSRIKGLEDDDLLDESLTVETMEHYGMNSDRLHLPRNTEAYEINGPFFFGSAERLKGVLDTTDNAPAVFILRLRKVPAIDATGLYALEIFHKRCVVAGTVLVLSGVHSQPRRALLQIGLLEKIGKENVCNRIERALKRAEKISEEMLAEEEMKKAQRQSSTRKSKRN